MTVIGTYEEMDRVGRIVVTVPYNPMASTKTTSDWRIDPSDPIAVAEGKYNRLVRDRKVKRVNHRWDQQC